MEVPGTRSFWKPSPVPLKGRSGDMGKNRLTPGQPSVSVSADSPGTGGLCYQICLLSVLKEDVCGPFQCC